MLMQRIHEMQPTDLGSTSTSTSLSPYKHHRHGQVQQNYFRHFINQRQALVCCIPPMLKLMHLIRLPPAQPAHLQCCCHSQLALLRSTVGFRLCAQYYVQDACAICSISALTQDVSVCLNVSWETVVRAQSAERAGATSFLIITYDLWIYQQRTYPRLHATPGIGDNFQPVSHRIRHPHLHNKQVPPVSAYAVA